ncbi:MAG: DUF1559 domain-containing protein, partial [Planctomycetota bacterium]|nr:DUF1559 domain-containing protein [Planctomycetota bacterium]
PYMEGQALRDAALGASDPAAKANLLKRMIATPVSDFQCPSRPSLPGVYRQSKENAHEPLVNAAALTDGVDLLGRSDYAANAGDADLGHARIGGGSDPGPANLAGVDAYAWFHSPAAMLARTGGLNPKPPFPYYGPTGVIFQRSEIALKDISDGTSKTYLMGEKFLDPRSYSEQGFVDMAVNNDQSLYSGASSDNLRLTSDRINNTYPGWQPSKDKILTKGTGTRLQEINCTVDDNWSFGSVHAAGFQAVMCDGAARSIPFGVARRVHRLLGSRADEELLEENF